LRPRPVNNKNPGEEIKMRLSLVSSLAAAAIIASTSAGLAIPGRGVALSEAAKSLELSQQAHYRGHYADRRCVCHVAHRPKVVVRKHFVRKHVVRPVVVVEEPEIIVRRRHFVHRPFFVHRAHFVDRPFFHRARFVDRPFFHRRHFGGMRFAGHGTHFGGHGRFGRW
jgi:hypothetical protein